MHKTVGYVYMEIEKVSKKYNNASLSTYMQYTSVSHANNF